MECMIFTIGDNIGYSTLNLPNHCLQRIKSAKKMNTDNANKYLNEMKIYQRDVWDNKDIEHPLDCLLEDYHQEQLRVANVSISLPDADNYDYLRGFVDGYGGEEPHDGFPDGFKDINEVWDRMYKLKAQRK